MIQLAHHVISAILGVGLIFLLCRGSWADRVPGRSIGLWHCAGLTIWLATAGMIFAPLVIGQQRGVLPALAETAVQTVRSLGPGGPGPAGLIVALPALPGLTFVAASAAVLGASWARMAGRRRRLRRLLDLVGQAGPAAEAAVRIDSPTPAAWCLPGRRSRIVITSATAGLLTPDQLQAVLRHEDAHLRQRHDLVLLPFQALKSLAPKSSLATSLHRRVQLLTEMLADDHALRTSRPADLARALAVLSAADPAPEGALGASGTPAATSARLRRIEGRGSGRLRRSASDAAALWILLGAAATVLATPLSLFLLPG
ncbi:M56 family metallopeptidase [Microlunatus sp. GCM10028923]|uniref:M56 family metallopeptidase n=1 Tax=Microlunatus sp. GCM10028923 TaxID=3273400 RepID=UPI00360A467A